MGKVSDKMLNQVTNGLLRNKVFLAAMSAISVCDFCSAIEAVFFLS
jgi:hypothetical protein